MHPLRFEPFLRPMVWGGRRLQDLVHKSLPDEEPYGESWEVSDHSLHQSVVANGALRGLTIRQLMESHREELLGVSAKTTAVFPWLIKFLDCHDWLSVQVHPDDESVKRLLPSEGGKTEAWFILHADEDSRVYAGLRQGIDERALRTALTKGTVADCLHSFHPKAGDCVFLPAGTVHAVGGGIFMAEVQQTSDATFRLFDWNRRDAQGNSRELHIDQAMACIDWKRGPVYPVSVADFAADSGSERSAALVQCPYFYLDYTESAKSIHLTELRMQAVLPVRGRGNMSVADVNEPLVTGHVWLVPAACVEVEIVPSGHLGLIVCTLP